MRIAFWAECLIAPPNGTRTVFENVLRRLLEDSRRRFLITFICPSWGEIAELEQRFASPCARFVSVAGRRWPLRIAWLFGGGGLQRSVGAHDVWLSGWHWPLSRAERPFVGVIMDLRLLERGVADQLSWPRRILWRLLTRASGEACVKRSAAVVAISETTRDRVIELLSYRRNDIEVIPLGVDRALWCRAPSLAAIKAAYERVGISANTRYVLAAGAQTPHKNFPRLIEAFSDLAAQDAAAVLVIAGSPADGSAEIVATTERLGLRGRVRIPGSLPFEELHALMHGARVFAFPSLFEGFGLPILEAFAAGTPVVTSTAAAPREVAGDAALCVDPLDVAALSTALSAVWREQVLRSRLIEAGAARVELYDWDRAAAAYAELLERAVRRAESR